MNLVFFHNYFITKDPSENSIICNTSSTCILVASLLPLQFYLLVVHHQYQLLSLSLYPYEESVHDQRGRGHHDQLSLNYRGRHPPIYHMLEIFSRHVTNSYEKSHLPVICNLITTTTRHHYLVVHHRSRLLPHSFRRSHKHIDNFNSY